MESKPVPDKNSGNVVEIVIPQEKRQTTKRLKINIIKWTPKNN